MKYSKNAKLNYVLSNIESDIIGNFDNMDEMKSELKRYKKEFPRERDYNYAQYGNVLIYYFNIRELYEKAGYKNLDKMKDEQLWDSYKRNVGAVIDMLLK